MKTSEQFILGLLGLDVPYKKALANLVQSLCSYVSKESVTDISSSPLFHYSYSILTKILSSLSNAENLSVRRQLIQSYISRYFRFSGKSILLQGDVTSIRRSYSPTMNDCSSVHKANPPGVGNKPIAIGRNVSYVNMCLSGGWSLPLDIRLLSSSDRDVLIAVEQLRSISKEFVSILSGIRIDSAWDSRYGQAAFLSPMFAEENHVVIVRFRSSSKVYAPLASPAQTGKNPKIYGAKHYLIAASDVHESQFRGELCKTARTSIFDCPADDSIKMSTTNEGKTTITEVYRWNNFKIRTKKGNNMKDKSMDIFAMRRFNADTKEELPNNYLFFSVSGQRKDEISTQDAANNYMNRFGIESFFRFSKQHFLLEKYQTSDEEHLDNWLLVQMLSHTLLYLSAEDIIPEPKPWHRYLASYQPKVAQDTTQPLANEVQDTPPSSNKVQDTTLPLANEVQDTPPPSNEVQDTTLPLANEVQDTPPPSNEVQDTTLPLPNEVLKTTQPLPSRSVTFRASQTLFLTFDKTPLLPQKSKNGKGRKKGTKLTPRKRYEVVRKKPKVVDKSHIKVKNQQNC